jgi:hypothetical protein
MNRRQFVFSFALGQHQSRRTWQAWLEEARAVHRRMPVFLGYCNSSAEQFSPAGGRDSDLEKFDAAGVRAFVCASRKCRSV